jgi:integrase
MASIRQRPSGKWQARIKRDDISVERTFLNKKDAERWGRQTEADIEAGRYVAPDKGAKTEDAPEEPETLGALFARYRSDVASKHRSRTTLWNLATLDKGLGHIALGNLNAAAVAAWRDSRLREVSAASVGRELATLGAVLEHARKEWCIAVPECGVKKPPQPRGRGRRLEPGEEAAIMGALAEHYRRVVAFALATCMRRGEILSLTWRNVDTAGRVAILEMTKNGEARRVPLSPAALDLLRLQREEAVQRIDGKVFDIHPLALDRAWRKACEKVGATDLHFHDLRREAVTRLLEQGFSVSEVSAISGHKTLAMLQRYSALRAEDLAAKMARAA